MLKTQFMKKIKLLFLLLITLNSYSQQSEEFKFTKDGLTDFIVNKVENKSKNDLFKKTIEWINTTYKNPSEVIKGQIKNEYIRFEGSSNSLICINILGGKNCKSSKYQVEVSFKDGRYKFEIIEISAYWESSQYSSGGWQNIELKNPKRYYRKNGKIRSTFKHYPKLIPLYFNALNLSLKNFMSSEKIPSKKDDW